MKDLNSPSKLEHFGYKHIGWNQFSDPITKGSKKKILGAVGAQTGCPLLPQMGVGWRAWRGKWGGGGGWSSLTHKRYCMHIGQFVALRAHCVCTAWALRAYCARKGRDTHPRIPVT